MKANDMSESELLKAAHNMENYGGGFAEAIALAYFRADSTNQVLLIDAFGHLFERYAPAQTCPHCARDLEDAQEIADGLCSSDDCPRHDE
jgi:hypothetical protein